MGGKPKPSAKRTRVRGATRGVVGAMAMSGMRQVEVGLGWVERTPPEAVLAEGVPALLRRVPEHRRKAAIELAHWGYGATAGLAFTLLPRSLRRFRITGPVYGLLTWGAFELAVAPVLGLAHARRSRPRERWALLVDHVVFGFVVGEPLKAPADGASAGEDREAREARGRRGGRHRS